MPPLCLDDLSVKMSALSSGVFLKTLDRGVYKISQQQSQLIAVLRKLIYVAISDTLESVVWENVAYSSRRLSIQLIGDFF